MTTDERIAAYLRWKFRNGYGQKSIHSRDIDLLSPRQRRRVYHKTNVDYKRFLKGESEHR